MGLVRRQARRVRRFDRHVLEVGPRTVFSVHFTIQYGWAGLLSFAVPNALGLVVFGLVLNRRARDGDLRKLAESAFARYPLVFAFYQVAAVALTLFALFPYFLAPLGLTYAAFGGLAVFAVGLLIGEVFAIRRLVSLQAACLVAAVLAATALLLTGPRHLAVPHEALGLPFAGFVVPLKVGLLLGPFFDIQQCQRAVEQQRQSIPVARLSRWADWFSWFCCWLMAGLPRR